MPKRPLMTLLLTASLTIAAEPPIALHDREVVVFYGDSITEQHLYTAMVECFLLTRLPGKDLAFFNFGWSGDSAAGGRFRFPRDAAPVKPTLLLVNFGMNDGGYAPPDQAIRDAYLGAQRELAAAITVAGAREVLLTTSPVDPALRPDGDTYNGTLGLMADGVLGLGRELGLRTIDVFHPMRGTLTRAKAADPAFAWTADSVHPDAVGHAILAYHILQRFDVPREVGGIAIRDGVCSATGGATVRGLQTMQSGLEFDLSLAFLPCPVPPAARPALAVVPFQDELNRLLLRVDGLDPDTRYAVAADGHELAIFDGRTLAAGVDLALLGNAPWARAGERVWELGQERWRRHFDAWRRFALDVDPVLTAMPAHAVFRQAEVGLVDALGAAMRQAAKPGTYRLSIARSAQVEIGSLELAPLYPWSGPAEFERKYPPETAPDSVAWQRVPFAGSLVFDRVPGFGPRYNCVVHARVVLEAARACRLRLAMGSDDGLSVIVNGETAFAHNVLRGMKPGEDVAEVGLRQGRNTLIFRVTQGGGMYGLAIDAKVVGEVRVAQVAP